MIKLYTTFYDEENRVRLAELLSAIESNLNLVEIDEVYVLNENGDLSEFHKNGKLKNIQMFVQIIIPSPALSLAC